ncbi:MAG: hypothetical protein K5849_04360 [Bacteroidales bacterium]|nr:hypothetical protein [Bacteroidales bacterium]
MKKILSLSFFLLCSIVLLAQRPANYVFKGSVSGLPGYAPVTCTINSTSGDLTITSKGNGINFDGFTWKGKLPAVVNQDITSPGAVWTGQLTSWTDITYRVEQNRTKREERLTSTTRNKINTAPFQGMTYDGKSVKLEIRVPYLLKSVNDVVGIPFTVTLDLTGKQTGETHTQRSSGNDSGGLRMPTGNTDISDVNYGNGITVGIVGGGGGGSSASAARASVGGVSFALAPGYTSKARQNLGGGQSMQINRPNSNDQLYLEVQKQGLSNVRNLSSDQVGDLLYTRVQYLNTVMPGVRMNGEPKIYYDDNSDGYYHPHAYSYAKGRDDRGRNVDIYTEATLINKNTITAGCVIAADKKEFEALTDIYVDAVNAAAGK